MKFPTLTLLSITMLSFATTTHAANNVEPTVVVIPVAGKSGIPFATSVKQLISIPLREEVTVIANNDLIRIMKKTRIKPIALKSPTTAKRLGNALKATHMLILEASGPAMRAMVHVRLLEVNSSEIILSDSFELKKNKLSSNIAADILNAVIPALQQSSRANTKKKDVYEEGDPTEPRKKSLSQKGKKQVTEEDQEQEEFAESSETEDSSEYAEEEEESDTSDTTETLNNALPVFQINLGTAIMQRTSYIVNADTAFRNPAFYAATGKQAQPYFAIPHLSLESFPLRNFNVGALKNLGLHGDLSLGIIGSANNPLEPQKRTQSVIRQLDAGLTYRFVIKQFLSGASVDALLGYNQFAFPLVGLFPGVAYQGPYAGLGLKVFVHPAFAITARGQIMSSALGLGVGEDLAKEFGKVNTGLAGKVGFGVKVKIFKRFELGSEFIFQQYNIGFTGPAKFSDFNPANQAQYSSLKDLSIWDRQIQFLITGGVVF